MEDLKINDKINHQGKELQVVPEVEASSCTDCFFYNNDEDFKKCNEIDFIEIYGKRLCCLSGHYIFKFIKKSNISNKILLLNLKQ